MKLIVAVVQNEDIGRLLDALQKEGIMATKLSTSGGFLRSGNTTLLIGIDDDRVSEVIDIISQKCKTRKQIVFITCYKQSVNRCIHAISY